MTLQEIIAKLEAATGPSREFDGEIAKLAGWTFEKMQRDRKPYWRKPGDTEWFYRSELPAFTASLDAAIGLVERLGYPGHSHTTTDKQTVMAEVWQWSEGWPMLHKATAPTPALALLLALCRALEQQGER